MNSQLQWKGERSCRAICILLSESEHLLSYLKHAVNTDNVRISLIPTDSLSFWIEEELLDFSLALRKNSNNYTLILFCSGERSRSLARRLYGVRGADLRTLVDTRVLEFDLNADAIRALNEVEEILSNWIYQYLASVT